MPGLNQLKQFNKDIQSLGDEITLRASRGEKPVRVPIPRTVEDKDDSADFELGMPEIAAPVDNSAVDDDLSDITGIGSPKTSSGEAEQAPSFEAPDMSSLLNPVIADSGDMGMPDLSMFMDTPEPEEQEQQEIIEEKPVEISIADMGLDALLSGAGFDGSEVSDIEDTPVKNNDYYDDFDDYDTPSEPAKNDKTKDDIQDLDEEVPAATSKTPSRPGDSLDIDSIFSSKPIFANPEPAKSSIPDPKDIPELAEIFGQKTPEPEPEIKNSVPDLSFLNSEPEPVSESEQTTGSLADSISDLASALDFNSEDFSSDSSSQLDSSVNDFGFDIPVEESFIEVKKPESVKEEVIPASNLRDYSLEDVSVFNAHDYDDDLGFAMDSIEGESSENPDLESLSDEPSSDNSFDSTDTSFNDSLDLEDLNFEDSATDLADETSSLDFDSPDLKLDDDVFSFESSSDSANGPDTDFGADSDSFDLSDTDFGTGSDSFGLTDSDFGTGTDSFESPDTDLSGDSDSFGLSDTDFGAGSGSFDLPDTDFGTGTDSFESPDTDLSGDSDSFGLSDTDFGAGSESFDLPDTDFGTGTDSFKSPDSDLEAGSDGLDLSDTNFGAGEESFDSDNLGLADPDFSKDIFANDDFPGSTGDDAENTDSSFEPDNELGNLNFESDSFGSELGDDDYHSTISDDIFGDESDNYEQQSTEEENFEPYDISQMDGVNFEIQETDSQLGGGDSGADDFGFDGGDFEIPGFSDVTTADTTPKQKKTSNLDAPDFSGAMPGKELPPNTLSDEQYKKFLKNFSEYPLNVRLAFENFIVQDEFTDDAEFEIIEKILNKAPARQVAANLEKMMDISIPVPRDFEHRTAAEYEAYKKSLGYQLKNKIIPFALIGMVLLLLGWGLFNFTKYVIVIPAQAESLYKQGYALLSADEYPQSEIKFDQAAKKKMKKKWFFKYAQGYREKKQYQRASKMYKNILRYFNHDKTAGLEYADMALNDLADYAGAEEIVRREILDFHANDPDAKLLLGDVFLEWGTEKDPEKLDMALNQYMNLLDTARDKNLINLYNSRLMRYYIRKDNLAEVLGYKDRFEPKEKNLSADDWTELSGYLLKKLYGPLAPNEEKLRSEIQGLRKLLLRSVSMNPDNPVALYNLGNYYVQTNEVMYVEESLKNAITKFNEASHLKNRDINKYIDSYRLLGENYIKTDNHLQAQEAYSNGITLYAAEKESAGFVGNQDIGHLYSDLADINYFVSGDYDTALMNYQSGIELGYDNPSIRYRLGYIQYSKKNYEAALGSFIKAGEGIEKENNWLLAMGNTSSLRNDDYLAAGNYSQLLNRLNMKIADNGGSVFPQTDKSDFELVTTYLYATNNYGVTLHRLAESTGDSSLNGEAIEHFQYSELAWDKLTRDQKTMKRLSGTNLAEENLRYVTHPNSEFEPSIYLEIPKTMTPEEGL